MAKPQTPPTTPPAMAPVFVEDLSEVDDVEVGVEVAVVVVDVEVVEVGDGVGVAADSAVSASLQCGAQTRQIPYMFH